MSEEKVRQALKHAAATGSDPFLALNRGGLLWDREKLLTARRDTLMAAAQLLDELTDSHIPRDAKQSAGAMKQWIAEHLRELARRQTDGGQNAKEET